MVGSARLACAHVCTRHAPGPLYVLIVLHMHRALLTAFNYLKLYSSQQGFPFLVQLENAIAKG